MEVDEDETPIGDLIDDAVTALTGVARQLDQAADLPLGGFADRLVDVLTDVAANVRGVDRLLANGDHTQAALVRDLIETGTDAADLISWRTTPIVVRECLADEILHTDLAPFEARIAHLEAVYRAACATAHRSPDDPGARTWSYRPITSPGPSDPRHPLTSGDRTSPADSSQAMAGRFTPNHHEVDDAGATLAVAHAAYQAAVTTYRRNLLEEMNLCAHDLGYNVPVVYATCNDDIDGEDDQLVEYLEAHALKTAQRPYLTVPTSRGSLPEGNDKRDAH